MSSGGKSPPPAAKENNGTDGDEIRPGTPSGASGDDMGTEHPLPVGPPDGAVSRDKEDESRDGVESCGRPREVVFLETGKLFSAKPRGR